MGFKPERKTFELVFEDYPGLEAIARGGSMGQLLEMENLKVTVNEPDPTKKMAVFQFMADRLVTWNMEHPDVDTDKPTEDPCPHCGMTAGQPMPTTVNAMMCLELEMVMGIFFGWIFAVARVSLPKGLNLNDGEMNTPEDLMNQLGKLQSLGKLPTPN